MPQDTEVQRRNWLARHPVVVGTAIGTGVMVALGVNGNQNRSFVPMWGGRRAKPAPLTISALSASQLLARRGHAWLSLDARLDLRERGSAL